MKKQVLTILPSGHGHWSVEFEFRGKRKKLITNNSLAVDRYNSRHELTARKKEGGYTEKQAYNALTHGNA